MFDWIKGFLGRKRVPKSEVPQGQNAQSEGLLSGLAWLGAADTPLGVRVLDCRSVAFGVISATESTAMARRFGKLRASTGDELRDRARQDAIPVPGELRYTHNKEPVPDGCAFRSECMEDEWDAFILGGYLYLRRSWSGDLIYKASISFGPEVVISAIQADRRTCAGDPRLAIRQVDYLVRSHMLRLPVAHPVPAAIGEDSSVIALYSFSEYGRRGLFASTEDTTTSQPWFFAEGPKEQPRASE